jgi:preprotein translocase subunit SecD
MPGSSRRWSRRRIIIAVLGSVGILAMVGTTLGTVVMPFVVGDSGAPPSRTAVTTPSSTVPAVVMKPLAVRPVIQALVATAEECQQLPPPPPPDQPEQSCDLDNAARYEMAPVALWLNLTGAKSVQIPASEFYGVQIAMDPASGAAFSGYTAANVGKQLAFVRDGVVLAAPAIDQPINGQSLQLSGNMNAATAEAIVRMLHDGS